MGFILFKYFYELKGLKNRPLAIFSDDETARAFVLAEELHTEIKVGQFLLEMIDLPETN